MTDRYEPPNVEELVGDDRPPAEVRRGDALMRSVPAPPHELPRALRTPPAQAPPVQLWTRRRALAGVALAAALSALVFGVGTRVGGDGFAEVGAYAMDATRHAAAAEATLRVGEADGNGNRPVRLEASGLPKLPAGGYYVLWLEKDGEYAGTCGTFAGGASTEAEWTVSYRLADYDAWIVTARLPGDQPENPPHLLEARIDL